MRCLPVASTLAQTLAAVIGHPVRVDSSGGLVALDHPPRVLWEKVVRALGIAAYPLLWLTAVGRQVTA